MKKRISGILLSLVLMLGIIPALSTTAYATQELKDPVKYLDAKGEEQTRTNYTEVSSSPTTWNSGWYVVKDSIDVGTEITVSGDVHLILCDNKTLTARSGIHNNANGSLTVYAQSTGQNMGALSATGNERGIFSNNGTVTINGGKVNATGGSSGIEAQSNGITINGGDVTASGTCGIYAGKDIAINGGTVSFADAKDGDKNQYDLYAERGSVTIGGATVNVTGQNGIYTRNLNDDQNVNVVINDGTVNTTGNTGYGIHTTNGNVMISDGVVNATTADDGIGICADGDITIIKGVIEVKSAKNVGIKATNITVAGGEVTAETGNFFQSAINAHNTVSVNGGEVTANGADAGIAANKGSIMITGGVVTANGSNCGIQAKEDLAISNGTVNATGGSWGTLSKNIMISESKVSVKATGYRSSGISTGSTGEDVIINSGEIEAKGKSYGINANRNVMINGGAVIAEGKTASGIYAKNSNNVIIEGGSVTATGAEKGIGGTVINSITGAGWTDTGGTTGKDIIAVSDQGQDLSRFRKVQFPAVPDPAKVTKAPAARSLTYNGSAQQLVTEGTAEGGTMHYALGKDGKTAPTSGWNKSIPTGKDAGDYYVWYKAVGNDTHIDSEPSCVKVTIAEKGSDPTPTPTPEPTPSKAVKSVTVNSAAVSAKTLNAAVKKAGGNKNTVTTITLGKKVKKISKGAFKDYKKAKTLVVKTKKLKKATVKKSLKGSEITKVKVKVGKEKVNKKYVKKYKKIFTKKNAGKKVKVTL